MQLETITQPALPMLTESEARSLTDKIKAAAEEIWVLLLEASERKAWRALGYLNWEAYIKAEFNMSRRHSYRLIDQGFVTRELESVTHGSHVTISERDARDLKPELPRVVETVREAVANVPRAKVAEIVQQVVAKERDRIVLARESREAGRALAEELDLKPTTPEEKERVQTIYTLYEALKEMQTLPSPEEAAAMVQDYERHYLELIPPSIEWLSKFAAAAEVK